METGLLWRPYFSPLSLLAAAVLLVVLAVTAYRRSSAGRPVLSVAMLIMRLVLIGVLALLLMGPSVLPPLTTRPGRPDLTILLDTSASMQTKDVSGQARFDFATQRWLNLAYLADLTQRHNVHLLAFDGKPRPLQPSALSAGAAGIATAGVSNIARSITDVLSRLPDRKDGSAVLVISDGHDSLDEPFQPAALLARAKSIPVHTVALGGATVQRDVAVVALPMQEYLLAGEEGQMAVRVLQMGSEDLSTTLHLRCGDEHIQRPISFRDGPSVSVELPIRQETVGLYEYRVSVDPVPGDVEPRNNEYSVFMEVTRNRLRVLLIEGQPFWDTKFIAQSLRKDERVELTQITQVTARKQEKIVTRADAGDGAKIPGDLEELARYDVVVIGRGVELLPESKLLLLLPEYVSKHGGRVVFARGRAYDPRTREGREIGRTLGVLEPVIWGNGTLNHRKLALEPAGRGHPIFALTEDGAGIDQVVADLPALAVMPVVTREKVLAKVLARSQPAGAARGGASTGQPAVVVMEYERGLVAAILGEGLWKWSLLPDEKKHLRGVFDRFWSNMIRWLAMGSEFKPGEPVSLRLSHRSVQTGDRVRFTVTWRFLSGEDLSQLLVIDPEGRQHQVALSGSGISPNRREARFTPALAGIHQVILETPGQTPERFEARFNAFDIDLERLQCAAHPAALRYLSAESAGEFLDPDTPEVLLDILERHRAAMVVPPRPRYIWDRASILIFVLVWAGLEWLIRKRGGLL